MATNNDSTTRTMHTPGPWEVSTAKRIVTKEFRGRRWREIDMLGTSNRYRHFSAVIVFGGSTLPDTEKLDADARLIASAPDLLAGLQTAAADFSETVTVLKRAIEVGGANAMVNVSDLIAAISVQRDRAIAALAKAEGRTL